MIGTVSEPAEDVAHASPCDADAARAPIVARGQRRVDLEWLRVIAMAAVFVVHTAHVFTPWQYWHIQNTERSTLLAHLTLFAWPWIMPLFMLLAGAGAWFSLGRRTGREFRRERTTRLLLPFLIGALVIVPPQIWVERLAQGRFEGSLLRFYPRFFECCYPRGNLAAGHLWFIGYLWVYSIVLVPLLRRLKWPFAGHGAALARIVSKRGGILLLAVPIVLTQVALRGAFPQSLDFLTDWANHALLIIAYVYGYLFLCGDGLQKVVDAQWRLVLPAAAAASAILAGDAALLGAAAAPPEPYSAAYFAFWTAFGVAAACWMIVLIGFARRYLRATPRLLPHAARAVFPIYLLHQTVIVLIAYRLVRWPLEALPKFAALLVLSFVVTTALAALAARSRPVRQLLGIKELPALRFDGANDGPSSCERLTTR